MTFQSNLQLKIGDPTRGYTGSRVREVGICQEVQSSGEVNPGSEDAGGDVRNGKWHCRYCGSRIALLGRVFDPRSGEVTVGRLGTTLSARQAQFLEVLILHAPEYVSTQSIASWLWGEDEAAKQTYDQELSSMAFQLRPQLKPLGILIAEDMHGYRVVGWEGETVR